MSAITQAERAFADAGLGKHVFKYLAAAVNKRTLKLPSLMGNGIASMARNLGHVTSTCQNRWTELELRFYYSIYVKGGGSVYRQLRGPWGEGVNGSRADKTKVGNARMNLNAPSVQWLRKWAMKHRPENQQFEGICEASIERFVKHGLDNHPEFSASEPFMACLAADATDITAVARQGQRCLHQALVAPAAEGHQ